MQKHSLGSTQKYVLEEVSRCPGKDLGEKTTSPLDLGCGFRVIIMTTVNSNDSDWVSGPLLKNKIGIGVFFRKIIKNKTLNGEKTMNGNKKEVEKRFIKKQIIL